MLYRSDPAPFRVVIQSSPSTSSACGKMTDDTDFRLQAVSAWNNNVRRRPGRRESQVPPGAPGQHQAVTIDSRPVSQGGFIPPIPAAGAGAGAIDVVSKFDTGRPGFASGPSHWQAAPGLEARPLGGDTLG